MRTTFCLSAPAMIIPIIQHFLKTLMWLGQCRWSSAKRSKPAFWPLATRCWSQLTPGTTKDPVALPQTSKINMTVRATELGADTCHGHDTVLLLKRLYIVPNGDGSIWVNTGYRSTLVLYHPNNTYSITNGCVGVQLPMFELNNVRILFNPLQLPLVWGCSPIL